MSPAPSTRPFPLQAFASELRYSPNLPVTRVVEGSEPQLFSQQFDVWPVAQLGSGGYLMKRSSNSNFVTEQKSSDKASQTVKKETLKLFDEGRGKRQVRKASGSTRRETKRRGVWGKACGARPSTGVTPAAANPNPGPFRALALADAFPLALSLTLVGPLANALANALAHALAHALACVRFPSPWSPPPLPLLPSQVCSMRPQSAASRSPATRSSRLRGTVPT